MGFWWNYVHYASKEIKELADVLTKDYYRNFSAMGFFDDHLFGTSHAIYAITHHKHLVLRTAELPEKMANAPVFIVGSGPSLDHDIAFLRKNQDKAYIIACGTALDTLYHAGIQPDIYCCTERTPQIAQSIIMLRDKSFLDRITLLTGDVVHPYTQDLFRHTAIFAKPDEPFFWMISSRIPQARLWEYVLLMNPLVGNMGVSGSLYLGFRNIYLFGLDNGRKVGQSHMHSSFTALYNQAAVKDTGGNYAIENLVPGNFGGECESGYFFKLSVCHIAEALNSFREEITCHNCSDGSLIEGAVPTHSEDLDFSAYPDLDKDALRNYIDAKKTMTLDLKKEDLARLIDPEDFSKTLQAISDQFKVRPASRLEYVQKLEYTSEMVTDIGKTADGRFKSYMLHGTMQGIYLMALRALYHCKNEAECIDDANKIINLFLHFLTDADQLYRFLPDFVLGPHQAKLHGKVGNDYPDSKAPAMPTIYTLINNDAYKDRVDKFVKLYS